MHKIKEFYGIIDGFKYIVEKLEVSLMIDLFVLVTKVFLSAHFSSCIFYEIGKADLENGWLTVFELNTEGTFQVYIVCLYFTFITMSTIGYGDYSPKTEYEMIYIICISLAACGIFGYIVS